jgi:hypothetical protein
MEEEVFLLGVGFKEEVQLEDLQPTQLIPESEAPVNIKMVEMEKSSDDILKDTEMGSQQLNNITESCPFVFDNMVPEWAQMFADSLKPLIQNL